MALSDGQIEKYHREGFLLIADLLCLEDLEAISRFGDTAINSKGKGTILERDGKTVRSVVGLNVVEPFFSKLSQYSKILIPVEQLLGSKAYVHQFKINVKSALSGEFWEWHQDFTYWNRKDGLPSDRALSAALFLDDVSDLNGPLLFVPGSHHLGSLGTETMVNGDLSGWRQNFSANLEFPLIKVELLKAMESAGIRAAKGRRGSVLFFHSNVLHGSSGNMSHLDRKMILISYNSVANLPATSFQLRPDFVASNRFKALDPIEQLG